MATVKGAVLFFTILICLTACNPIPFEEACEHMGQKITVTGYLATAKFTTPGFCGVILSPRRQVICNFDLHGQADRKGEKIEVAFFLPENLSNDEIIKKICKSEPVCALDGNSRFSLMGVIEPADSDSYACGMDLSTFEDFKFIP